MDRIPCLTCHERAPKTRGCCAFCYGLHRRQIRKGLTTWEKLIKKGLAAAPQRPGEKWRKWDL